MLWNLVPTEMGDEALTFSIHSFSHQFSIFWGNVFFKVHIRNYLDTILFYQDKTMVILAESDYSLR